MMFILMMLMNAKEAIFMKYAIYDKAADAYLTKMEFDVGYSDNTQFACGLNEYITKAQILDTKEAAYAAIARIERFKFMGQPGRFVIHSFDDTLNDQYIISEAGNPTKVVGNITVDLNGAINVKYGTMMSHWSASSLNYVVNRLNRLQDASAPSIYTSWNNTFDIYKVITIMDEKEHTHYQFINVTAEGLEKYSKDEKEKLLVVGKELTDVTDPLHKRIEELGKANYELGEQVSERGAVANRLLDENNSLKAKVEAIKKEARDWKELYKNADRECTVLKNVIDNIYDDLGSTDIRKGLKETYDYVKTLSKLNYIEIHNDDTDDGKPIYITAAAEFKYIIHQIITIMESLELKNSEIARLAAEKDKALERAEFYKRMANSVYGMIIPVRRCGKQVFADVATGKKIIIDKVRYDSLVESVDTINTTYDILKRADFTMNKPAWLPGLLSSIKDLTK